MALNIMSSKKPSEPRYEGLGRVKSKGDVAASEERLVTRSATAGFFTSATLRNRWFVCQGFLVFFETFWTANTAFKVGLNVQPPHCCTEV